MEEKANIYGEGLDLWRNNTPHSLQLSVPKSALEPLRGSRFQGHENLFNMLFFVSAANKLYLFIVIFVLVFRNL